LKINKKSFFAILCCIISTSFLFLLYAEETTAKVSPDSAEITDSIVSPDLEEIPDSIVSLSSGYVIVVDKQRQRLYVFYKDESFSKVFEAPCSTGKNLGAKKNEGDARTPNGIFFITRVLTNPGPPETFGSMAFPLDYPTIPDLRANRDGNNIWIHGTTKELLPRQSNGCVVLQDNDLKRLANFIYLNKTPVVISESIKWVTQNYILSSKNELEEILLSWNRAFIEKDIKKIDSLYMSGFEIKGKKRKDLVEKINQVKPLSKHFMLNPRDISILQEGNNAVIMFDQIFSVSSASNTFHGFYNKLFLERINNKWYAVDDVSKPQQTEKAFALNDDQKEIQNLITKWLTSWKSGDMKTYRSCYDPDGFQSRDMNIDGWIAHKTSVRDKSRNINIRIDSLQISVDKNKATAFFNQHYSSSIFSSKGEKKLELKNIGNQWKIYREIM
jgi:murein L,D-transpeptidase YafK